MTELVKVINNEVVTNSAIVADMFRKEHKNVVRDIDVKLNRDFAQLKSERGEISKEMISKTKSALSNMYHETTYKDKNNQNRKMYIMNRDGALNLIMGYTGELAEIIRVQFINAFSEMEKQLKALTPSLPNFANPVEAARAWADATEKKQLAEEKTKQLEAKIKQDEDKVEFADVVQASDTCIDMGDVAKILNIDGFGRNKIFDILRKNNIMNKKNIPYAEYIKRGYFKMSEYPLENPKCPGEYWAIKKVQVTQKGLDYIRRLFY